MSLAPVPASRMGPGILYANTEDPESLWSAVCIVDDPTRVRLNEWLGGLQSNPVLYLGPAAIGNWFAVSQKGETWLGGFSLFYGTFTHVGDETP